MRPKKNKLLIRLVAVFSFLLFKPGMAQVPIADFAVNPATVCVGGMVQVTDQSAGSPTGWSYTLSGTPNVSSSQNPTVSFNSPGIYTLSLIATNGTGPSTPFSKTVTVNANPVISLTGNNAFCAGGSVTQTVSGADTYLWSTGGVNDTETFNPAISTNYTVTGTYSLTGCSDSKTLAVTVNTLPVLSVSGNSAVCFGSSVTQTVTGADTYSWNDGSTGNIVAFSPTVATNYTVTGTNTLTGCSDFTAVPITVNSLPLVAITGANTLCAGSSIMQTASGADSYLWANSGATSDIVSISPASSVVYTVTGTNTLTGCSDIATTSITVISLPSLTLTGNNAFCIGGSATQTVSGANIYLWSTGSTNDNETFSPASSTLYTVTGTDAATGCSDSKTLAITVNTLPVISVSGNSAVCFGSSVTQTATGADTYSWNDGSTGNIVAFSPTVATSYTVTGTNTLTGCSDFITVPITVNPLPIVAIAGGNTLCAGSSITQTASGADAYLWSNSGATADVIIISPASSVVYTVTGTNTLTGCSDIATAAITIISLPSLTLSGNSAFCIGGSATQTVTGADDYMWSTGSINDNETFSPPASASYTVTGTDAATGCSASKTLAITVNPLPVLSVSGNSAVCIGSSVSQTVTGANTYSWNDGSTGNIVAFSPTVATSYTVTGTNTLTGCFNSTSIAVAVNPLPVLSITGNNTVCAGSAITQTVVGADAYLWSNNGATSNITTFNPLSSAVYSVTGTNTLTGCSDIATASITAIALPSLTLTGASAFCAGGSVTQTVAGADAYSWSSGSITDSETFSPPVSTTFSVTGTNTLNLCANTIPVLITVNSLPTITVNNGSVCAGQVFTMSPSGASTYTYSNASATVIPVSNISYSVTGTSTAGCISSNTAVASVTVNALPTVTVNSGAICIGSTFTIVPGGALTYTISGGTNIVSPTSSSAYSITGTSTEGCVSSNASISNVTVNALPSVSISGNTTICVGQTATLNASGATTFSWNNTTTNASNTVSPVSNTSYSVIGIDNNGCSNSASQLVTVNPLPTVTVNSGTICQGGSFVILASGADSYIYSSGTDTVSPMISSTYSVTGMSTAGCQSALPAIVTVSVVNAVTVTVSGALSICNGAVTTLTATGATSYTWTGGALTSTVTLNPTSNTAYAVIGVNGPCTNSTNVSVVVNALPTISATSSNPNICVGETAVLTASGASTYTWDTTQNGAAITVTPSANVTYTVNGIDANGCANVATVVQNVSICEGINASEPAFSGLNLYPNPNNGEFIIEVDNDMTVTILNAIGQTIYHNSLQKGINNINLEDQAKGIYFVNLQKDNLSKTLKVIKK